MRSKKIWEHITRPIIETYGNIIVELMVKHLIWYTKDLTEKQLFKILKDKYKENNKK